MIKVFFIKGFLLLALTSLAQQKGDIKYDSCRIYATEYDMESRSSIGCDMLPYLAKDSFLLNQEKSLVLLSRFEAKKRELAPTGVAYKYKTRYSIESRALFVFYGSNNVRTVVVFGQPGLISFDDSVCYCSVNFFREICDFIPGLKKVMKL